MHPPAMTDAAPARDVPSIVPFVSICGWCNGAQLPSGEWVDEVESAGLLARHEQSGLTVSHGICPSCFALTVGTLL